MHAFGNFGLPTLFEVTIQASKVLLALASKIGNWCFNSDLKVSMIMLLQKIETLFYLEKGDTKREAFLLIFTAKVQRNRDENGKWKGTLCR